MPHVQLHGSVRENDSDCVANMATIIGNKDLWWGDIECIAARLEALKKFADLSV
jgi:hypothetical protein